MTFIALLYSPSSALHFAFSFYFFSFFSSKTTFSCLLSSDSRASYLGNVQKRGRCGNILQCGLLLDIVRAPPYQDNSLHFIPFATLFPETSLFALKASMRRLVQIRIEFSSLLCLYDDVSVISKPFCFFAGYGLTMNVNIFGSCPSSSLITRNRSISNAISH